MSKKINILYVSPNGYLGGAERAVIDFCHGHQESKTISAGLLFFNEGMALDEANSLGIKSILLKSKFKLSNISKLFIALLEIRRILKRENIGVIHSTMPYAHIVMTLASLFLPSIKRVWFQHGPVGGTLDKLASLLPIDSILYNSNFTKIEHLKTTLGNRPACSHHIINLPIIKKQNLNDGAEIQAYFQDLKGKNILLQVGRICSWKGNHLAILALNELVNNQKQTANHLIIVGSAQRTSDIAYYEYLKTLSQTLNLSSYIDFIPNTKSPHLYMKNAHILLHTSTTLEPFGLVVAEAMLNNLFVIGSNKGGVVDILKDQKTGYSFDTNIPSAAKNLSQKIQQFQNNAAEVDLMKQRAFDHITKNYNISDTIKVLENIYLSF